LTRDLRARVSYILGMRYPETYFDMVMDALMQQNQEESTGAKENAITSISRSPSAPCAIAEAKAEEGSPVSLPLLSRPRPGSDDLAPKLAPEPKEVGRVFAVLFVAFPNIEVSPEGCSVIIKGALSSGSSACGLGPQPHPVAAIALDTRPIVTCDLLVNTTVRSYNLLSHTQHRS
jgi:hypothetical protein